MVFYDQRVDPATGIWPLVSEILLWLLLVTEDRWKGAHVGCTVLAEQEENVLDSHQAEEIIMYTCILISALF